MNMLSEENIYTVSELSKEIRALLETAYTEIFVKGELSSSIKHNSGHAYFNLKENNDVLKCVMWRSSVYKLDFKLEDGIEVIAAGRLSAYSKQSNYQLVVDDLRPVGVGALLKKFEELKAKLAAEGLFSRQRKKPIPQYFTKVGIITSATAAALQDFLRIIKQQSARVEIYIISTLVQGAEAPAQIKQAIRKFNKWNNVDLIVITRGGGSVEDLWAFNDESLAREIAESKIPIISAIGHEVDFTITDFVSDLRVPTPTAAAGYISDALNNIYDNLINLREELINIIDNCIGEYKNRVLEFKRAVYRYSPLGTVNQMRQNVDNIIYNMFKNIVHLISSNRKNVDMLNYRIRNTTKNLIQKYKNELDKKRDVLLALNPEMALQRGYCRVVSLPDNETIKSIRTVGKGDEISVQLSDGRINSKVVEVYYD